VGHFGNGIGLRQGNLIAESGPGMAMDLLVLADHLPSSNWHLPMGSTNSWWDYLRCAPGSAPSSLLSQYLYPQAGRTIRGCLSPAGAMTPRLLLCAAQN
jgi:hypothetical protein